MDLQAQLVVAVEKANAIKAAAEAESRELTTEEMDQIDGFLAEADTVQAKIDEQKKANDLKAKVANRMAALDVPKPVVSKDAPTITNVHPVIEDDPKRGFQSRGEYFMSVMNAGIPNRSMDQRLLIGAAVGDGQNKLIDSEGGFVVPPEFSTTIWDGLNSRSDNLLAMTTQFSLAGGSLTIPANGETSRVNGSRWGGLQSFWTGEEAEITSSKATFRQIKLEPNKLAVLAYITDELMQDGLALDSYLTNAMSEEILFKANDALVNGTGAGQPLGVLNANAIVSVAKETGQAATTIVKENLDKMYARLHPRARGNAVWLINVDVWPELLNLSQDVGTGGTPVFLNNGSISGAPLMSIYSRPVIETEYNATLGTVGDVLLVDLSYMATALKGGVDMASSIHLKFEFHQTAFRATYRMDSQPFLDSAITPKNGSNTLSPFISLATRA